MVTLAEFVEQVVWSGGIMLLALATAAYVRFRYKVDHEKFVRMSVWWLVSLGLVVFLSLTAEVREIRCTDNPAEWCRYNDNIPFIATVVFAYFVITCGRAFFMHFNR